MAPSATSYAAETIACAPEPHTRFMVKAGTVTGSPAWGAGFILFPACTTLPMTTVATSSGLRPARSTVALIAARRGQWRVRP